eukprot:XP_001698826.1 predicted protein [Chlamydomonas reinhardtii]
MARVIRGGSGSATAAVLAPMPAGFMAPAMPTAMPPLAARDGGHAALVPTPALAPAPTPLAMLVRAAGGEVARLGGERAVLGATRRVYEDWFSLDSGDESGSGSDTESDGGWRTGGAGGSLSPRMRPPPPRQAPPARGQLSPAQRCEAWVQAQGQEERRLREGEQRLQRLEVSGDASSQGRQVWPHVGNEHMAVVGRLTGLTSLRLNHVHPVAGRQLAACLSGLRRLRTLGLTDALSGHSVGASHVEVASSFETDLLEGVAALPLLETFSMELLDVPPPQLAALLALRSIRLDQVDIRTRDPDGWTALSGCRCLEHFSFRVWNNPMLSAAAAAVSLTEKAEEHLAHMPCLVSAHISGTDGTTCRVSSRNGYVAYSDSESDGGDSDGSEASVNWRGASGYVTSEYDAD